MGSAEADSSESASADFIAKLAADLPAHCVFLLVQSLLLCGRDVAVVEFGHCTLLVTDRTIFTMDLLCLTPGELTLPDFLIDPPILIGKAVVDLITAWVVSPPLRFR